MDQQVPWHDNDEFWQEFLPALLDESLLSAAPEEAQQAAALLQVSPPARILDLGCGPGRHSIALSRFGYKVVGVDRTALYLEHARRRASEAGVDIELVHQSMLDFRRDEVFDGVVNLLTSFGYFPSREDDLTVLRNVHASLKPGGRLVLETIGKETLARIFAPKHWQELGNRRFWLQDREVIAGWEKMRNRWLFVGAGECKEFLVEHRIFSGAELAGLLELGGFHDIRVYGGLNGCAYERDSMRLVVVGTK